MNRPELSGDLSPEVFKSWYWLKKELQTFCSAHGLPVAGSKEELTGRVHAHLSGQPLAPYPPVAVPARQPMPQTLDPDTVIGPGWRLNAALRAFFVAHTSSGFRFKQALRELFADPQGRTLGQALETYRHSLQGPRPEIQRQFQFNQHIRDYFSRHPGATRAQALQAWRDKRQSEQTLAFPSTSR